MMMVEVFCVGLGPPLQTMSLEDTSVMGCFALVLQLQIGYTGLVRCI